MSKRTYIAKRRFTSFRALSVVITKLKKQKIKFVARGRITPSERAKLTELYYSVLRRSITSMKRRKLWRGCSCCIGKSFGVHLSDYPELRELMRLPMCYNDYKLANEPTLTKHGFKPTWELYIY